MLRYIKKKFIARSLNSQKISREKKIISLDRTRSIGMLCQITDEESYKEIHNLFSKIHSHKRSAWLLGYIDEKKIPYFCLEQLSADYFSKRNLNWFGKPNFVQLHDFLQKDFDILIDFSRNDLTPLRFILSSSKAKLIIGANVYSQDLYDIFINDETQWNSLQLLKIIHNYLHKLTGECTT